MKRCSIEQGTMSGGGTTREEAMGSEPARMDGKASVGHMVALLGPVLFGGASLTHLYHAIGRCRS